MLCNIKVTKNRDREGAVIYIFHTSWNNIVFFRLNKLLSWGRKLFLEPAMVAPRKAVKAH